MNFSIHVDDGTARKLARAAALQKRTRNSIVTEAVKQWLERTQPSVWPQELLEFEGDPAFVPFENFRPKKKKTGARFP